MPLNVSGPISLGGSTVGQSINLQLGQAATDQVSLNDASVRTLAGVSSGAITMPTNFWGKGAIPQGDLLIVKKSYPPTTTVATFDFNPTLGGGSVGFTGMPTYNNSPTWGPWQLFDDTRSIFDWCNDSSFYGGQGTWTFPRAVTMSTIFVIPRAQGDNFPNSVNLTVNGTFWGTYYPTTLTNSSGQQINYSGTGYKIEPNVAGGIVFELTFAGPNSYIGEIEFWGS